MKIGIDISQIVYQGTGVGRFTQNLVESILSYDQKNQYLFFFSSLRRNLDNNLEQKIKNSNHQLIKWKIPPTLLSFFWNDLHQLSQLFTFHFSLFNKLDWFISSDWSEPPLSINKTTIVHDLVYKRYPNTLDKRIVSTQEKRMRWVKKETKIIFADSQSTKDDMIKYLNIEEKKIIVNYPGVTTITPKKEKIQQTLKKYQLKRPFILSVGKLEPRKNLERLIQAFIQLNNKDFDLVITGSHGWGDLYRFIDKSIQNIKVLNYIPDNELYSLYRACFFFIYPSLWEGFGYPILEAMKLGAPVACSNTSSMKEIAGNSTLLFDPFKTDDIFHCINTLIHDEKLRKELINKGKIQAEKFSWQKYIKIFTETLTSN